MRKAVCILLSVLTLATLAGTSMASNAPAETLYAGKTVILCTGNLRGDLDVYPQIAQAKKDYESKARRSFWWTPGTSYREAPPPTPTGA